jgi:hypothetical protein
MSMFLVACSQLEFNSTRLLKLGDKSNPRNTTDRTAEPQQDGAVEVEAAGTVGQPAAVG